jgi:hypothetical protein
LAEFNARNVSFASTNFFACFFIVFSLVARRGPSLSPRILAHLALEGLWLGDKLGQRTPSPEIHQNKKYCVAVAAPG